MTISTPSPSQAATSRSTRRPSPPRNPKKRGSACPVPSAGAAGRAVPAASAGFAGAWPAGTARNAAHQAVAAGHALGELRRGRGEGERPDVARVDPTEQRVDEGVEDGGAETAADHLGDGRIGGAGGGELDQAVGSGEAG